MGVYDAFKGVALLRNPQPSCAGATLGRKALVGAENAPQCTYSALKWAELTIT